jgi:serine/threonine-protein kinase
MTAGTKIGPYEIVSPLGAGGMGEVYRASDTRLGRQVAIKVLPEALAGDAQYMARFEREAQLLAALHHPHIASVFGLEGNALVMELVEGPTLLERMAQGAVPVEEAVSIARQIAEGLEAAHEKGIIHRDLKPANVKITPEGVVKLLDFGLAKTVDELRTPSGQSMAMSPAMSPTLSLAMTQAGMILGTAAYMSPEQARGKPVDKRADIWAFGVVLYEMLAGRQLFGGGETVTDTLAAVVTREPDFTALPSGVPERIRRLIERCLRKDPKTRLRDIGEARLLIDEPEAAVAVESAKPRPAWPWAAMACVLAVAAGAGWWKATRQAPLRPLMTLDVEIGPGQELGRRSLAISPDGTRLAVVVREGNKRQIGVRMLHQRQMSLLAGTEGADYPFFSTDGEWIGFGADGKLKKIPVAGGAPVTLCDAPFMRGASWGDDGNIIVALTTTSPLSRVSSGGGTPVPVTTLKPGERTHRWPRVAPGSEIVLFTAHIGAGNFDGATAEAVSLKTGERKTLQRNAHSPWLLASGHLIYQNQGTLYAAPFDAARLALKGTPAPIVEDAALNSNGGSAFSASSNGTFVYLSTGLTGPGWFGQGWLIVWLDSAGKKEPLQAAPKPYLMPRVSPDGKRLAFTIAESAGSSIWVKDLARDTVSRLSFLAGENQNPVWTPDGKHIVFRSFGHSAAGVYWIRSDGSGEPQALTSGGDIVPFPVSFTPDGRVLALNQPTAERRLDLVTAMMEGGPERPRLGPPQVLAGSRFQETGGNFSPDGRWIAYSSDESGTSEIYVRPYPAPGGRWQISNGGGQSPAWSRNGREIFFEWDRHIHRAACTATGTALECGKPRQWADFELEGGFIGRSFDVTPDGKRLAVLANLDAPASRPSGQVTLLLNFIDELKRRLGEVR